MVIPTRRFFHHVVCNPCATAITRHGNYGCRGEKHPHRWGDMNNTPPYVGYVNYGKPFRITYTEEVVGSSPIPPTFLPPPVGVLFYKAYWWGMFRNTTLFDEFRYRPYP
jgi:hypothetical protein